MNSIKIMQQALEALDSDDPSIQLRAAIELRTALAQPEQEPVAWCLVYYDRRGGPIYSNPTMHYQSAEAMAVMSEGRVEVVGLCVETPRTKS